VTDTPPPTSAPAPADTPDRAPAIVAERVTHTYPPAKRRGDPAVALQGIDLAIAAGRMTALLGPNGSGKSTLIQLITTALPVQSGRITLSGHDVSQAPTAARASLGVVFQQPALDGLLTARENLALHARLSGIPKSEIAPRVDDALAQAELTDRADDRVGSLSGGMTRRIDLARAILPEPDVLILDEPTEGLDLPARDALWQTLGNHRQRHDTTVLLTTHRMDEAERCDRVALLKDGQVIAEESVTALRARLGDRVIAVHCSPTGGHNPMTPDALTHAITEAFAPWPEQSAPVVQDGTLRFEHPRGAELIPELIDRWPDAIDRVELTHPRLDDVFRAFTGQASAADEATEKAAASGAAAY